MNNDLIWENVNNVSKHFEDDEVKQIFLSIAKSDDYWKRDGYKEWGNFLRLRDICIIATMNFLGLRPKEACCLRFDDIDKRTMRIHVHWQNNKTKKSRILPLPKQLMDIYRSYFALSRQRFWRGSKYLFPSMENEHVSPSRIKHIFREKALKPSGLWQMPVSDKGSKYTPTRLYAMRHSFATRKLNQMIEKHGCVDWEALANLLGHTDLRSTKIYAHKGKEYTEYLRDILEM